MKKWYAWMLTLALLATMAMPVVAEEATSAVVEEATSAVTEQAALDWSALREQINAANEEKALVAEHGIVSYHETWYDEEYDESGDLEETLADTDEGFLVIIAYPENNFTRYYFADKVLIDDDGELLTEQTFYDDFDEFISWQVWDIAEDEVFLDSMQNEDGTTTYRTTSDDGQYRYEYTVGESMLLTRTRKVLIGEDGSETQVKLCEMNPDAEEYALPEDVAEAHRTMEVSNDIDVEMNSTDGSEMGVYIMIDALNDETNLVKEYGSLNIYMDVLDEDGNTQYTMTETMADTEYGKVMIAGVQGMDFHAYSFFDRTVVNKLGDIYAEEGEFADEDEFEATWQSQIPIPTESDMLFGIKSDDETGITIWRTKPVDGSAGEWYEYTTGDSMLIQEIMIYDGDEEGNTTPKVRITFENGGKVELPEEIKQAYLSYQPGEAA